ncbi:MAG: cysteine--tRNA ligase, partial [Candidatus Eremiobacteraeota bacterium]|nr:cysteine--tRNA ligase [Candidatus Eremiobacteraeota bacterium]
MLRLYNTRTHRVEPFEPLRQGEVRLYVCGLTPSAEPHLGHTRTYLFFDVLRRYLRHLGYRVTYVQNVTDIDDRSILAAQQEGRSWREVVEEYYSSFKRSMRRLAVMDPDAEPRATEYIAQIVTMIEGLIAKGAAYVSEDGVYFRVASFPRYGALSGKRVDELMIGVRVAENEKKADPLDFALWKFEKPGEPSWPSPWGAGRPGWHIECSAMCHELLGEPFDIHGGGDDLIFPHHENEIAQTESLFPPPMANFWLHGGLLLFEDRKMSKRFGNYEPVSSFLDRHDPQAIRLLFLQTGYHKPMNYTDESIAGAKAALLRLRGTWKLLYSKTFGNVESSGLMELQELRESRVPADHDDIISRVQSALSDDMNTAEVLAVFFDVNNKAMRYAEAGHAREALQAVDYVLSLVGLVPNEHWLEPIHHEMTFTATANAAA